MSGRLVSRLVSVAFVVVLVSSLLLIGVGSAFAAVTRVEQTSASVTYTGVWNNFSDPLLSGGSYTWMNSPATATFLFSGTGVAWIGMKNWPMGYANVSLDGGTPVQVNLYSAVPQYQQVLWSATGLANGPHTLVISWTGTHPLGPQPVYGGGLPPYNPAALVNVDAFDVYTPTASTPASSPWSVALVVLAGLSVAGAAAIRKRVAG